MRCATRTGGAMPRASAISERGVVRFLVTSVPRGAEGADVDGVDAVGECAAGVAGEEVAEDADEGAECFAAAGGGADEGVLAGVDGGDGEFLWCG